MDMATNRHREHGPYGPYSTDGSNVQDSREYQSQYSNAQAPSYNAQARRTVLTQQNFLNRVAQIKDQIDSLSSNISEIGSMHQQAIWSSENPSSRAALESVLARTQALITEIKNQINGLEFESTNVQYNSIRESQLRSLKNQLKTKLTEYREQEIAYKRIYQEQIARQYKIINPDATESEIHEAVEADWGNEGVFQTAAGLSGSM
jgi:syntaxin 1B/2/3